MTTIGESAFESCDSLTDVYYGSTEEDWNKIAIGYDNDYLINATIHFTEPTIASGTCGDNLTWTLYKSGLLKITGTGAMTDYSSSSKVPWHSYRSNIISINIGDGVTTISDNAFSNCENLTSITIPDSVTSIDGSSFSRCSALVDVYYTGDVAGWCEISFGYGSATPMLSNPMYYAENLYISGELVTSLVIPDDIKTIGQYAFYGCEGLTEISMSAATTFSTGAFIGCDNFHKVTLRNTNGTMCDYTLSDYSSAPWYNNSGCEIVIEDGIANIGDYAFYNNRVPFTVTVLGYDVEIPQSAFYGSFDVEIACKSGSSAHAYAKRNDLTYTLLDGQSAGFTVGNGMVLAYSGDSTSPVIPSGTTAIGSYAFMNNSTITSIVLPNTVTDIYTGAFAGCENLERIVIPESVTTIASTAFNGTDVIFACVENSYAHLYAVEHGIEFELTSRENGVSLTSRNEYITVNGKTQLSAVVTSGSNSVIWSSSDSTVASVDSNGLVTGKKAGSVVITVATADGYKDFCLVRVVGITGSYNKGTVIDPESSCIYGLDVGLQSISDYVELVDESCTLEYDTLTDEIGTGTITNVVRDGEIVDSYTVIIFGDIDGNGWYDANDAFIVNMIASGLIPADRLSAAQFRAADCNHDGAVDSADFYLLNQASLMLEDVDQSATKEELATNAMYIGYCSLIDQSAGKETNLVPAPEATPETTPEISETEEFFDIEAFFSSILDFIKKIFTIIFSF